MGLPIIFISYSHKDEEWTEHTVVLIVLGLQSNSRRTHGKSFY